MILKQETTNELVKFFSVSSKEFEPSKIVNWGNWLGNAKTSSILDNEETKVSQHKVDTGDARPIRQSARRLLPCLESEGW